MDSILLGKLLLVLFLYLGETVLYNEEGENCLLSLFSLLFLLPFLFYNGVLDLAQCLYAIISSLKFTAFC